MRQDEGMCTAVDFFKANCIQALNAMVQVYAKLARAREWEGWLSAARLVHTAQPEALETGNTFCCTSRLVFGFVDGIVEDAEPSKVQHVDRHWHDCCVFQGDMRMQWPMRRIRLSSCTRC